jgi:hypothetical protein
VKRAAYAGLLALDTADAVVSHAEESAARWHTFTSGCLGNGTQDFGVWSLESAALPQFAFGLETAPRRAAG